METTICPDCIEELVSNRKKLGELTNWLVCPICGYRVRESSILFSDKREREIFTHELERTNKNNCYQDLYNTENYEEELYLKKSLTI
jgi:uncharacterized protein YbaR (Trm112 family)